MLTVRQLTDQDEKLYERFLAQDQHSLLYHSTRFRHLLKQLLKGEDHYFIAWQDGKIVGALPAFRCESELGSCLNSLPFFGSNGGIIELSGNQKVRHSLLEAFERYARSSQCLTSNIITSPFEDQLHTYERYTDWEGPSDKRFGQVTVLSSLNQANGTDLYEYFHPFTRRMIRKAQKNRVTVKEQNDPQARDFLATVHRRNMEQIGGKVKPDAFFELLADAFEPAVDYKIWTAFVDDQMIAALLLLYYNRSVEYYIPAILQEYRNFQAQSLIIYRAMQEAATRGYQYWNWGGTWPTQPGVYRFKKRWNTRKMPYYYYHRIYDPRILNYSKADIQRAFPYCYVVPFDQLKA